MNRRYTLSAGLLSLGAVAALVGAVAARRQHVSKAPDQPVAVQEPVPASPVPAEALLTSDDSAIPDDAGDTAEAGPDASPADLAPGEAADVAAGLAYIEELRAIPGAAPLVDDVLEYLKNGDPDDFSLGSLPVDEHGFATVDEHFAEHLIKDPDIRAKWQQLMALAAARQGTAR